MSEADADIEMKPLRSTDLSNIRADEFGATAEPSARPKKPT